MGTSSSKNSNKRLAIERKGLSVNLASHSVTSIPERGKNDRAPSLNQHIYLPPPAPPPSQSQQHSELAVENNSAYWRAYDANHHGDLYSPIVSSQDCNLGVNRVLQEYRQRRRRNNVHDRLESNVERSEAAKASSSSRRRRLISGGGAVSNVVVDAFSSVASGGGGGGGPSRSLVPFSQAPSPSSSSPSHSGSYEGGSLLDLCYCAECCLASEGAGVVDSREQCFCNSSSTAGEGVELAGKRRTDDDYDDDRVRHGAFLTSSTLAGNEYIQDRQNFRSKVKPLNRQQRHLQELDEQQIQALSQQLSSRSNSNNKKKNNNNIATNNKQDCCLSIPTSSREIAHQKRKSRNVGVLEVKRANKRNRAVKKIVSETNSVRTRVGEQEARPENNDEATTCSAESTSDLQNFRRRRPSPLAASSASSASNHYHHNINHSQRALRAIFATVQQNNKTSANIMASSTISHSRGNASCNGNGLTHFGPSLERGLALDEDARKRHGLLGLLPAAVQDQTLQSKAVVNFIDNCKDELSKYVYLRNLKDFNERLFYYTLMNNVQRLMPIVYTPTVGLACQKYSEIYMRPRGLFITINDSRRIRQLIGNWPEKDVRVIVVTDGERILGLGDLGANGMGICIGKLSLYTALAKIPPRNVLPITIDVGTENEFNLNDPFYIGLRQNRVRGEKYEQLIDEFMLAVVERWGRSCLVQFEDFGNATAFKLLKKYADHYCTFNDDIQGTASVSLSGLLSAAKLTGKRLSDCTYLFYGAGEANLGTAQLLITAMVEDGLTKEEAKQRIWLVDSKGLVVNSRQDLSGHKRDFSQDAEPLKDLEAIIDLTKPTAIVGASAQSGSFNESICKKMASYNERPIIFALSNPTSKAECTAEQAYRWTAGKCVFASGSPFEPVEYNGKTYITGQGNNAYIFPAVGLAAIGAHTHVIPNEAFLVAAKALSEQVTSSDFEVGLIYPKLSKITQVTLKIAARVLEYLYAERLATYRPEPSDKLEFLRAIQYDPSY